MTAPREEMRAVENIYVDITTTLRKDRARPDCRMKQPTLSIKEASNCWNSLCHCTLRLVILSGAPKWLRQYVTANSGAALQSQTDHLDICKTPLVSHPWDLVGSYLSLDNIPLHEASLDGETSTCHTEHIVRMTQFSRKWCRDNTEADLQKGFDLRA